MEVGMPSPGSRRGRDLKAILLEHGIALAREGGPDAVSLRDVQRRAGVSNSAAYRHYADRDALLVAISDHASAQMAREMEQQMASAETQVATADPGQDPPEAARRRARARFRATGSAYIGFALAEPGLFAVAMHPGTVAAKEEPGADARGPGGLGPYQLLVSCVDELVTTGVLAVERRAFTDVAAWAAVHGLAVLLLDGPLSELGPDEAQLAIDRLLDLVDAGLR
jgi:AcrR family transcriptional regulator